MPNRILKESICESEKVNRLAWHEEVFFYRLIVNCDDYGRFDARPKILRTRLFPLKIGDMTESTVQSILQKLAVAGLVLLYEYGGRPYLQLTTWEKHQQIRAKKSKYPDPSLGNPVFPSEDNAEKNMKSNDSICPRNPIQSESNPNQNPKGSIGAAAPTHPEGEKRKPERHQYGEYGWVMLTDDQYSRLVQEYGEDVVKGYIAYIDESAQQTGNKNKWKDWNLTIRKAIRCGWGEKYVSSMQKGGNSHANSQGTAQSVPQGDAGKTENPWGELGTCF